jgi:copper(I)-binding protein
MSHRFPCGFRFHALVFVALAIICASSAAAQQVKIGDLVLDHAWSRATPGGAKVGGGYLTIQNKGAAADKLIGGSSPVAGHVEVHEMAIDNGVMTMRLLKDGLPIPAGQSVKLAPGGYHIMLMELKAPLKKGEKIPVTLKFEKAGDVKVTLGVQDIGATSPGSGHMDHTVPGTQQPMKMSPDHKM